MSESINDTGNFAVMYLSLTPDNQQEYINYLRDLIKTEDNQVPAVSSQGAAR